jgi:UDP-N-acetylmuramyl pentapeptide phosphotransferase/UDP-N-acetylglucosamine-1-phosphate transferase
MLLNYFIVFLSLLLLALIYHRLALKFNIIDKPNLRSSHIHSTVRGGGILFPIAVVFWWMVYDFDHTWMVLGIVWISAISLLDDIYTLSSKVRFGIQFIALSMAFYDLGVFGQIHWIGLPLLYFIALGIINAINFMDGINGITGLYGLVFLGSILAVNAYTPIFDEHLIRYEILAICVFLIFNLRRKALMFAGDIGSISLAYLMIYFLVQWYLVSGNWTIVLLLVIYGVDAFLTMAQRIKNKENVLKPHRSHLYQLFVNQGTMYHVNVALIYALLQLAMNFIFFIFPQSIPSTAMGLAVLGGVGVIYVAIKYLVMKKYAIEK